MRSPLSRTFQSYLWAIGCRYRLDYSLFNSSASHRDFAKDVKEMESRQRRKSGTRFLIWMGHTRCSPVWPVVAVQARTH